MSFLCPDCGDTFYSFSQLHWHLRFDHGLDSQAAYDATGSCESQSVFDLTKFTTMGDNAKNREVAWWLGRLGVVPGADKIVDAARTLRGIDGK